MTAFATKTPHAAPAVVSPEEWPAARKALLAKEKEAVRLQDLLAAERRNLPWEEVRKNYVFDAADGTISLHDLFSGRSQLLIYHFMFGPDWQEGCPSCSFVSDHFDGALPHLAARDVSLAAVSRAPVARIEAFKSRLGWKFPWVSSGGNDFNADFHVSFSEEERAGDGVYYNYGVQPFPSTEAPGLSVFTKGADGTLFHTYSSFGRGVEALMGTYRMLDLVPRGRNEEGLAFPMEWVRYHDRYENAARVDLSKADHPKTSSADNCGCAAKNA